MTESKAETGSEPRGQESTDLPGAVSSQNGEEAESGHRGVGSEAGSRPVADGNGAGNGDAGSPPGASGEGSQATGHPDNAG